MKNSLKKIMSLVLCAALLCSFGVTLTFADEGAATAEKIKVACVGDSITAGSNSANYPMYLQEILGDGYEVKNFGLGGAAVRYKAESDGSFFWYGSTQYLSSLEYDADVVFVMMGTNDVGSNLLTLKKYFKEDYYNYLVKPYLDKGSKVVMMTSPYAYYYMMKDHMVINTTIRDYQLELAEEKDLQIIDMNTATANMRECFPDGLHGNASGYTVIAQTVYEEYFGGELAEVTVKTQPKALVTAGRMGINANAETGEATLKLIPGTHDFAVTLDGYKSVYGTITAEKGKSKCEVPMSEGGKNVAKGSLVTVSSESGEFKAKYATDGSKDTRWQANWGASQWMTLDMGKAYKIGGVRLLWEPAFGKAYDILVSTDGVNYESVASVTDGDGATDEIFFNAVDARYLKLDFKEMGSQYGYSLYEVEVMESDGTELTVNCGNIIPETVIEKKILSTASLILIGAGGAILIAVIVVTVVMLLNKKEKKKVSSENEEATKENTGE